MQDRSIIDPFVRLWWKNIEDMSKESSTPINCNCKNLTCIKNLEKLWNIHKNIDQCIIGYDQAYPGISIRTAKWFCLAFQRSLAQSSSLGRLLYE
jgi:hypothetical protein